MRAIRAAKKVTRGHLTKPSFLVGSPRAQFVLCLMMIWFAWDSLTFPKVCSSAEPAPKIQQGWVTKQIQNLDTNTLKERTSAERALLDAGPDVLPLLPAPELLPSDAVRQAVRRIRLRLEEAKARESVKASTVTIQGSLPLKDILKTITEQTGNNFHTSQLPAEWLAKTGQAELRNISYWKAMSGLAEEFGFDWDDSKAVGPSDSRLQLVPAAKESQSARSTVHQAFFIEVESLKLRPRFGVEDQQLLRAAIRLTAEPRLRPLFLKVEGQDFSVEAGDKKLSAFTPAAKLELPLGEAGTEISFSMDFEVPKPFGGESIDLKGKATLTVAAGSEQFAFSDLAKDAGAAKRRGGVTVTLNEIEFQPDKKNPDRKAVRFRITVHYDTGGPAFESHRTWMFHNEVYLENAQGEKIERTSDFHTALQTDGGVTVEYNFDNLAGEKYDYKFVYIAPTLIINVPVSFDFENLPAPKI